MMRYGPDGHYLIITAASVLGTSGKPPPVYPKWLRIYLVVLVSITWFGLLIASAVVSDRTVPAAVHVIMGVVCASLFSVEFGGIRLVTKKEDPPDAT